jgi:hypothetical protein
MPRFRPRSTPVPPQLAAPPTLLAAGQLIDELMQPGHFFVARSLRLQWIAAKAEDVPWEVFRGRLVDPAHTRQQARLLSWHVVEESGAPLISVRLDVHAGVVHVTRGILCYVWEGYDAGDNVIQSREVQRWITELVGSAELDRFPDLEELRDELVCLIWQAVVGTSRLPLHSVEAPLPAFSFGELHYVYRPSADGTNVPMSSWDMLDAAGWAQLSRRERAHALESLLRHLNPANVTTSAALVIARRLEAADDVGAITRLLRTMFNEVSLSPYTCLVENTLRFLCDLSYAAVLFPDDYIDFFVRLLCQLCRHLTAYNLITFHHRGANYPDALLVDALLQEYCDVASQIPEYFRGDTPTHRLRRRALRQARLVRHQYQDHLVPDAPTSPGENVRVISSEQCRVPEEQLLHPHRRHRRLFADSPFPAWLDSMVAPVFVQSLQDLGNPAERIELGIGLFIDRPLGYSKLPGEPDYTPLLAHEAFSRSIARQRLKELATLAQELSLDLPADFFASVEHALDQTPVRGVPAERLAEPARPTTSLSDVRRVADDFVIVRTMPGGLGEMLGCFALPPGPKPRVVAMIESARGPVLGFFDEEYRLVMEAVVDTSAGFVRRAGIELPVAGLRVLSVDGTLNVDKYPN